MMKKMELKKEIIYLKNFDENFDMIDFIYNDEYINDKKFILNELNDMNMIKNNNIIIPIGFYDINIFENDIEIKIGNFLFIITRDFLIFFE